MTISELLLFGKNELEKNSIDNSQSEALWLLENTLDCTYTHIMLNGNCEATKAQEAEYRSDIQKRIDGTPVQYIIGEWEFYGREFKVGEGVLIPRPETELLVDYALEYLKDIKNPVVIDLCAGTGCIGITVALERPDATVYSVEKYDEAFAYLKENSKNLTNINLIQSDVLTSLESMGLPKADLVLSNPPYIKSDEVPQLQSEVLLEPHNALDGGEDGLMFYRAIKNSLGAICKGNAAMECGENQAEAICQLFGNCKIIKDFADINRVVVFEGE